MDGLVGYIPVQITGRIENSEPQDLVAYAVSANYFPVLGIELSTGRAFTASEEARGAASRAIIRHSLWRRRYPGDAQVVGREIAINDRAFTIIGVGPEQFTGTEPLSPEVWFLSARSQSSLPGPTE